MKRLRLRALPNKQQRLDNANQLIQLIASTGRRFFHHKNITSRLLLDYQGRIIFHDAHSGRHIYTHYEGTWRGFTQGGTLRNLIITLREYIQGKVQPGEELIRRLGLRHGHPDIFPHHPWGYPEPDMATVLAGALRIFGLGGSQPESHGTTKS